MTDNSIQSTQADLALEMSAENIESLRHILEDEQGRSFSFDEAHEIARSLINFFEALAGEAQEQPIEVTTCASS